MMRRGIGRVGRRPIARTMARTAVVAGTATVVAGGVAHHQQGKQQQAAAPPPPPPAPAAPAAPDSVAELERLAQLKAQGVLTDEEFSAAKAKLLGL